MSASVVEQREGGLADLVQTVFDRTYTPEDKYEVAAILESSGINDSMAQEVYGARDIFDLAETVWLASRKEIVTAPAGKKEKRPLSRKFFKMAREFLRGTIFALPMGMSIFAMLTIHYSLWSYLYFTVEIATSIAIGTILSFMVTGGFTQAIARRGFLYMILDEYQLARRMSFFFVRLGLVVSLIVGILYFLFVATFSIFSWRMIGLSILYFLFLCFIWLSVTVMYMLRRETIFAVLIGLGIAMIYVIHKFYELFTLVYAPQALAGVEVFREAVAQAQVVGTFKAMAALMLQREFWAFREIPGANIIYYQVIALTFVAVVGMFVAAWIFLKAERQAGGGMASMMPRLSIVVYTSLPYFVYGFLYFTFLFIDRINAWSANSMFMPYLIWFRGEYELGLDWALLTLIIPIGMVELIINEFSDGLVANQKNYTARQIRPFNNVYLAMYRRYLLVYTLISVGSALLVYFGMIALQNAGVLDISLFMNRTTYFVFGWAVVGYAITAAGLLSNLFLFCLSQPEMVVRAMAAGCITNYLVGFLLSRWVDYSWAVFGLVAGAVVFTLLSTRYLLSVLNQLDYYLYAAA